MKKCKDCFEEKEEDEFYGIQNECKECTKKRVSKNPNASEYGKTEKGVVRVIYKTQKSNSKRRCHNPPTYSKDELREWLYKNGFKKLYDEWVKSGYEKNMKPSIDRLDDFNGYSFSNIKLGTWEENKIHQHNDILSGIGTGGKRCKTVECIDNKDVVIATYVSRSEACRVIGYCIDKSLYKGIRDRKNGYKWRYN